MNISAHDSTQTFPFPHQAIPPLVTVDEPDRETTLARNERKPSAPAQAGPSTPCLVEEIELQPVAASAPAWAQESPADLRREIARETRRSARPEARRPVAEWASAPEEEIELQPVGGFSPRQEQDSARPRRKESTPCEAGPRKSSAPRHAWASACEDVEEIALQPMAPGEGQGSMGGSCILSVTRKEDRNKTRAMVADWFTGSTVRVRHGGVGAQSADATGRESEARLVSGERDWLDSLAHDSESEGPSESAQWFRNLPLAELEEVAEEAAIDIQCPGWTQAAREQGIIDPRDGGAQEARAEEQAGLQDGARHYLEHAPATARLGRGRQVMTWEATVQEADADKPARRAIGVRVFGRNGQPESPETLLTDQGCPDQRGPQVVTFADGGFAVAWVSYDHAGGRDGGRRLSGCMFNADGTPACAQFTVAIACDESLLEHSVASLPGGGVAVMWLAFGYESGDSPYWRISLRTFNADGSPVADEVPVQVVLDHPPLHAQLHALSGGNVLISWQNWSVEASGTLVTGLRAQVFAPDGHPVSGPIAASDRYTVCPAPVTARELESGDIEMAWEGRMGNDAGHGTPQRIRRLVGQDGAPRGAETLAPDDTAQPRSPAGDPGAYSFVVWWDSLDAARQCPEHPQECLPLGDVSPAWTGSSQSWPTAGRKDPGAPATLH